jgi:hypothetical protein
MSTRSGRWRCCELGWMLTCRQGNRHAASLSTEHQPSSSTCPGRSSSSSRARRAKFPEPSCARAESEFVLHVRNGLVTAATTTSTATDTGPAVMGRGQSSRPTATAPATRTCCTNGSGDVDARSGDSVRAVASTRSTATRRACSGAGEGREVGAFVGHSIRLGSIRKAREGEHEDEI